MLAYRTNFRSSGNISAPSGFGVFIDPWTKWMKKLERCGLFNIPQGCSKHGHFYGFLALFWDPKNTKSHRSGGVRWGVWSWPDRATHFVLVAMCRWSVRNHAKGRKFGEDPAVCHVLNQFASKFGSKYFSFGFDHVLFHSVWDSCKYFHPFLKIALNAVWKLEKGSFFETYSSNTHVSKTWLVQHSWNSRNMVSLGRKRVSCSDDCNTSPGGTCWGFTSGGLLFRGVWCDVPIGHTVWTHRRGGENHVKAEVVDVENTQRGRKLWEVIICYCNYTW